jgi:putative membrane protein
MNLFLRMIITAGLVMIIAHVLPGIKVSTFLTALYVAIVLGLLNVFIKPIIILFTLPVTLFTLGLFLLVINAIIILLCTKIVDGFDVASFWSALLFSIILSISQSIVFSLSRSDK